jgi:hypothetical protein
MLNLSGISLSDADLWALKQALAAAQPPSTPVVTPPAIPPTGGHFVPPPLVAGRSAIAQTMPWANGARVISAGKLADGNFWALHFKPASGSTARLVGAESGGGPVQRQYVIYRADTGEVIGATPGQPQTTVQPRLAIDRDPDHRYWEVRVDTGVEYVLGIVNAIPGATSAMYMDLFLS